MIAATPKRRDVRFLSGSHQCSAWLYLSQGASTSRRVPVVVMAHGLGGVKRLRLDAFAERFRDAGYACLVFDYRHFGESEGEPRELLEIASQREDWRAAVAYARSVPELDGERVVVWGTSFGGGHAITTAAHDTRIVAAIAQCPFSDGISSGMAMNLKTIFGLIGYVLRDLWAKLRGSAPVRVPLAAHPGEVGLMTAPDVLDGYRALLDSAGMTEMPDRIPARFALDILRYFPGRHAKDVKVPILFCVCERDSVAPARATLRYAARAPKGEIRLYDVGHFAIYAGEPFEQVVRDQLQFLKTHVPVD